MTIITASTSLDEQGTITVEIPIGLLHRAQCARSDYGDYGSGDAEHDTLGEFVDLTVTAAGIPGTGEWTLTAPITNPAAITASSLWTIAAAVPSDLGDTLEFQAQKGGGATCSSAASEISRSASPPRPHASSQPPSLRTSANRSRLASPPRALTLPGRRSCA